MISVSAMVDLAERLAVVTFTGVLSLSAVGIFLWMAASHWADMAGTTVGVILLLLAACQLLGSIVWFRFQRRSAGSVVLAGDRRQRDDDVDEREL